MEGELRNAIEKALKERKKNVGKNNVNEADFLCGAMQMYLQLNPDSEADGSWCPPSWVLGIMRGDKITEHMSTTKEKIMAVARKVLREYETMSASGIAERVNSETRDGVHVGRMAGMLKAAKDIEQVPRTREPIEWRLKGNVDATETGGET